MTMHRPTWITPFVLAFLLPTTASAQSILVSYQNAEKLVGGNLQRLVPIADVRANWIGQGGRFWYSRAGATDWEFLLVDPEDSTSGPAFDQPRLTTSLSRATGRTYEALPFDDFKFSEGGHAIRFEIDGTEWTCSLSNYDCGKMPPKPAVGPDESLSPNGQWAAFVRDHNLYLRDVVTGTVSQLTYDGVPGRDYATPLPDLRTLVAQQVSKGEDVHEMAAVFWSPDSTKLVTFRLDSRGAGRFSALQYVPPDQLRPRAYDYVYPLPGELLPTAMPVVFDLASRQHIDVKTPPLEITYYGAPEFHWLDDGRRFYYLYRERGQKALDLREVDATTGEQRTMLREEAKPYPYVDPGETMLQFVNGGREFLWTSERNGWNQLYLYNAQTGQMEEQLTHGEWVVRQIVSVDEKTRQVYFLAGGVQKGMDPYFTQLFRVGLDGHGMKLLTPEDANHEVSVSPDGKYFIDNYSRPDLPGRSDLRRTSDGSVVRVLERTDDSRIMKMGWKPPIPFRGKATDGQTDLYGIIIRPTTFDASKKYPILEYIYTGPQGFFAPKTFAAALRLQSMAELGFAVVMVDGRGTTGRSRAFHDYSYHNLGGAFIDHVTMIKEMARQYPWLDSTRVGIYGSSAGGYGSAHAFLQFPDFYKVGVSTAGDHDPRLDKASWNELYQGYPIGDDYVNDANQTLASRVKGHLLLIHGDIDQNVHPTATMHLVDALMTANKSFDMLFVPNMNHGDTGPHALYVMRRRWDYFVRYLLGTTPPEDFEIHCGMTRTSTNPPWPYACKK
ncbi:MAG: DPP IV N-terminal domain-containing protein [Gemmatimonadaceae bacterium]